MNEAEELIRLLNLEPLPLEGGWYRETWRSRVELPSGPSVGTAIYYLLTPATFSALHRLANDEVFHFYAGDPVEMLQLGPEPGVGRTVRLGADVRGGARPQVVVPANVWQGSRLAEGGRFALLGTTMAPGFDFADFELGVREELVKLFPEWREQIAALCR
jgi:predicted cupin superfamily sugar epimerase